jgi:hypothetical protein
MARSPIYKTYLDTEQALSGFSSIAPHFWRTAEKLRDEAVKVTAGQSQPMNWTVHSAICLYHTALDCFINEEIAINEALTSGGASSGYEIQGMTLNAAKFEKFYSYFGVVRQTPDDVLRRALLLVGLRNRLHHHWPEMRDVRDYPVNVIDALTDAQIEKVNTSWTAQCSDVRLAKWAAEIVRAFVEDWWQIGRGPSDNERAGWKYGPDYPTL